MKIQYFFTLLLSIACITLNAQKISIDKGDLKFLKNQKKVNIEYNYDKVGVGKYKDEKDYIEKKVIEYNKAEPGKGDKWKQEWIDDRKNRFQPGFEQLLNEYYTNTKFEEDIKADYTMIVKTTFVEPGFNVYVTRKNASINLEIEFVKTGSPEVIAKIILEKSPGRDWGGYDFDTGYRIEEAYNKAGKELGKFFTKKIK